MKKNLIMVVVLVLLMAAPISASAQGGGGGTLVGAFDVGPGGCPQCRPFYQTAGNTWLIKIWSPLVSWNETATGLSPQLAVAWETNEDASVWTFKLREGVLWHDGVPFTAEDVRFTFELALHGDAATLTGQQQVPPDRIVGGEAYFNGEADEITGIRVVDDLTVVFEMTGSYPRLPYDLARVFIMPKHALTVAPADLQNSNWFFTQGIGTGPFMVDEYVQDQFWAVVPNPNYWNGAPKLDRLINRYFADETSAVLALQGGEIQFTYVSGDVAARLESDQNIQMFQGSSGVTNYLIFNMRNPIFQDIRVRQAFLYAVDRKTITEVLMNGTAEVLPCLNAFPEMRPPAEELNDYAYDPDKARALLAEAGWDSSQKIEVVTYYDSLFHMDALAAMQQFLADVGVEIIPTPQDVPTYNSYFYTGEGWDISYRGLANNVGSYPWFFYEPGGYPELGEETLIGVTFPELMDLFAKAKVETDHETYLGLLQDICKFQNENALEGYMWVATRFGAASNKLVDFYWFPAGAGGPYEDHPELWAVGQ